MLSHYRRTRCQSCNPAGEQGFTLLELIVAMTILAVIIVPLALAMITGYRVVDETAANLQGSVNRETASALFSQDVAAVDATGVSTSPARACGAGGTGTFLFTLNATSLDSTGSAYVRRVSYWGDGTNDQKQLLRRVCEGPLGSISLTPQRETIMADRTGRKGVTNRLDDFGSDFVPGTYCDEFRCTLNVTGRVSFELRAQRRTFGAGVPLEIGRLYGTAFTRQAKTPTAAGGVERFRYAHYDKDGNAGNPELAFGEKLSLAPGLDGPDSTKVEFAVQQVITNSWLAYPGDASSPSRPTPAFNAAALTWVVGDYDAVTETWSIPLGVGTEDKTTFQPGTINAGGRYKVFTRLTELGAGATPKTYGGTCNPADAGCKGFPMWFDFNPDNAVFVSASVPAAADPTGIPDPVTGIPDPVRTIKRAVELSKIYTEDRDRPSPEILIASGQYTGDTVNVARTKPVPNPTNVVEGIDNTTFQGGFPDQKVCGAAGDQRCWVRVGPDNETFGVGTTPPSTAPGSTEQKNGRAKVVGTALDPATAPVAFEISGLSGWRIRQVDIRSGKNEVPASGFGAGNLVPYSRYGIRVTQPDAAKRAELQLEVHNSDITTDAPMNVDVNAPAPIQGSQRGTACKGRPGATENRSTNTGQDVSTFPGSETDCSTSSTAPGANGGRGGNGGGGGAEGDFFGAGSGGANGGGGAGAGGGAPGGGGGGGYCVTPSPGVGGGGAGGIGGAGGSAASVGNATPPTATVMGWTPGRANSGGPGRPGTGGGGAGGGGGTYCAGGADGHQGASGGHGGAGATGGQGGLGGGSTFGIYLFEAGQLKLINAGVQPSTGGNGQDGARGGRGGNGGAGGQAGTQSKGGDSGGAGGGGGGGGGAGGTGGFGGDSIAVFTTNPGGNNVCVTAAYNSATNPCATTTDTGYSYLEPGNGGTGGKGGLALDPLGAGGTKGGGGGGLAGPGASQTILFFFNYTAPAGGDGGGAATDAANGRDGATGRKCRVASSASGACVVSA